MYDVACQWHKHFLQRIEASPYLQIPDPLKIIPAVGKFHLKAHIDECFFRFSLNFLLGVGQADGETMETLWAGLNRILGSTRSMTKHHRQQVLNDYMQDANWKKLIGMGKTFFASDRTVLIFVTVQSLQRKWKKAVQGLQDSRDGYDALSEGLTVELKRTWSEAEAAALIEGGDALMIYQVKQDKGEHSFRVSAPERIANQSI